MVVPVRYEPFEAKKVPVGEPPAQAVVVEDEQATTVPVDVTVYPDEAVKQEVDVDIIAQLARLVIHVPETKVVPVAQYWQAEKTAEAVTAVYKPPVQLVGVTWFVGAVVTHVIVPLTPPHQFPEAAHVHRPTVYTPNVDAGAVSVVAKQPAGAAVAPKKTRAL